jgi:pyocin large subunit-like protein
MAPCPSEVAFDHQNQVVLGPERLQICTTKVLDVPSNPSFLDSIRRDIKLESFAQDLLNHIDPDHASSSTSKNSRKDYRHSWRHGLFFRNKHLYARDSLARLQV